MSKGGAYSRIGHQERPEFRGGIGSYNPQSDFSNAILSACAFSRFKSCKVIEFLDLMAAAGKVGKEIIEPHAKKTGKNVKISFNDVREEPLLKATDDPERRIACDVKEIADHTSLVFDIVLARYVIKDIPKEQQRKVFEEIKDILMVDAWLRGRLIVADMYTSLASQKAVNLVHSKKQEFAGRKPENEGVCHIPTLAKWKNYALGTDFSSARVTKRTINPVDTQKGWQGQFGKISPEDEARIISELNKVIASACEQWPSFAREYNVRVSRESGVITNVKLDFPIMVMVAEASGKLL
ncbi:MAG: hypothetical protein PHS02_00900 [Candidatus ainarchaeum sp.]|nr:hypothetical protein [Candidatus ainarchaeum sp.]